MIKELVDRVTLRSTMKRTMKLMGKNSLSNAVKGGDVGKMVDVDDEDVAAVAEGAGGNVTKDFLTTNKNCYGEH